MCLSCNQSAITELVGVGFGGGLIVWGLITRPTSEWEESTQNWWAENEGGLLPCSRQFLNHSWWPLPLCLCLFLSPWVWAGPSHLLLTYRIQQRWWDVTSGIRVRKIVTSVLLSHFLSELARFGKARCLVGEAHMTKNWGRPLASSNWGVEILSPAIL